MAKGAKGIYLMPVVRASGDCGWYGEEWRKSENEKVKSEVDQKGIIEVGKWARKNDRRGWWGKEENERLQDEMKKNGFSITRTPEIAKLSGRVNGADWTGTEAVTNLVEKLRMKEHYSIASGKRIRFLYKNAGVLGFTNSTANEQSCNQIEHYFPLDLVILGETEGKVTENVEWKKGKQTITINDTILKLLESDTN